MLTRGIPVTPSDTVPFADGPCRSLVVATGGTVRCQFVDGLSVVTLTLPAGQFDLQIRQVFATGTSASGISALY